MDALSIFALVVLTILVATFIGVFVFLAMWPGRVAKARNHPQAEAITALGWIGIITLGASWLVAIVWAYYIPSVTKESEDLKKRIESLEGQLHEMQAGGGES